MRGSEPWFSPLGGRWKSRRRNQARNFVLLVLWANVVLHETTLEDLTLSAYALPLSKLDKAPHIHPRDPTRGPGFLLKMHTRRKNLTESLTSGMIWEWTVLVGKSSWA
jgi:hypothetical protein